MIKIGKGKFWFGGARFQFYFLLGGTAPPAQPPPPPPLSYGPAPNSIHSLYSLNLREASHIDFVHDKRHMDVGGLVPVTFLGEKSWKISIVC